MGPHCEPHYLYGILILYTPISTDFGNDVGCIAVADDISMVYVGSDDCTVRALSFEGKPPPPTSAPGLPDGYFLHTDARAY